MQLPFLVPNRLRPQRRVPYLLDRYYLLESIWAKQHNRRGQVRLANGTHTYPIVYDTCVGLAERNVCLLMSRGSYLGVDLFVKYGESACAQAS